MRKNERDQRGFALLMVMMIVAFVGLGAAALLDLVNVDIGIAVEHRKSLDAQSGSVGAVLESVGDNDFMQRLPGPQDPDLRTPLVIRQGASYVMDPEGVAVQRNLTSADSAHIERVGQPGENGYESDVRFLRLIPPTNSSTELPIAVYEVRARATVSGGDATSEARALVYRHVNRGTNIRSQRHAR